MISEEQKSAVLNTVNQASLQWQKAFNQGNAVECASFYETNAVLRARPFGTYIGTADIQEFWQKLMHLGFTDLEYIDPQVEVIDVSSAILKSGWKMNKAQGVINKELWVIQSDGSAKLHEDDFEAKGNFAQE